jgi:two-component system, chemotaxis family, response regulator Rcp1
MSKKPPKPIKILLIEDCASDVALISKVFGSANVAYDLQIVEDGVQAIAYLHREGIYSNVFRPNLILLDLNLPKMDGLKVLAEIKSDPDFCSIPVIVLTASNSQQDMLSCHKMDVNCYLTKPSNAKEFQQAVTIVLDFWLKCVTLP